MDRYIYSKVIGKLKEIEAIFNAQNMQDAEIVTISESITMIAQNSFYAGSGLKGIEIQFQVTEALSANDSMFTLPDSIKPAGYIGVSIVDTNSGDIVAGRIGSDGQCITKGALAAGFYVIAQTYR